MFRRLLASAGLHYLCHSPIQRGKVRLARILDKITRGVPLKAPLGPVMSARLGDTTFWLNMKHYQSFVAATVEGLQPGDVFIDIGANIGMFTLAAAQRVGPDGLVLAFEPSLREFQELTRNLWLNRASNVIPFRIALDEMDALSTLFLSDEIQSGLNSRGPNVGGKGIEPIAAMRFDALDIGKLIAPDRRVFVKIDTEGCELRVLLGMREFLESHNVERVVAELDDVLLERLGATKEQVYEFMKSVGFVGTSQSKDDHFDEVFVRTGNPDAVSGSRFENVVSLAQ